MRNSGRWSGASAAPLLLAKDEWVEPLPDPGVPDTEDRELDRLANRFHKLEFEDTLHGMVSISNGRYASRQDIKDYMENYRGTRRCLESAKLAHTI